MKRGFKLNQDVMHGFTLSDFKEELELAVETQTNLTLDPYAAKRLLQELEQLEREAEGVGT